MGVGGGGVDLESAVVFSVCFVVLFFGWGGKYRQKYLVYPHHPTTPKKERKRERGIQTQKERRTNRQTERQTERLTCE